MNTQSLLTSRPDDSPKIYAFIYPDVPSHEDYIKIGYTTRSVRKRVREITKTSGLKYRIIFTASAIRNDGSTFRDSDVHAVLRHNKFPQHPQGREWFRCKLEDVKSAVEAVRNRELDLTERINDFTMRGEQAEAVSRTAEYFTHAEQRPPKFLWNAKMRFGKTFAAYQLCRRMKFTKILVLTFKPAVESAWSDDIRTHVDFEGWQFISNHTAQLHGLKIDDEFSRADKRRTVVVFGSFQDLLGTNDNGGIKAKNEFIHLTNWDIVIFDEYHFGAWRENARKLFVFDDEEDADFDPEFYKKSENANTCRESSLPITAKHYLYLSGTPFRALNNGEFIEEQIYNWTYSDEQKAKYNWSGPDNPYEAMPKMIMMTYQIPESIRRIAMQGEFDGFDLNEFFAADKGRFIHEDEVRKWLLLIRGAYLPFEHESLKLGKENRPPMPYTDSRLLRSLNHTLWFLPNVGACRAMSELLRSDAFFRDYRIILCAGNECGNGIDALPPVREAIGDDPLNTRTITLSCGKLTTGVTVPQWSGIFMLRNLKSPETYFQAAFRVQSAWTAEDEDGGQVILKPECYIFDFALERALKQVADYSCRLNIHETDPEKKIEEFMNFLPVLAFDGATMKKFDASDVLDMTLAGTSAVLLARRWESALLVNVDNETLSRLMNDPETLEAVMNITAFRNLNKDIETIITRTEHINKLKGDGKTSHREEISAEEKANRKLRKEIQEKLLKFITRVPAFMYLTDDREKTLYDVITQIAPGLFRKVTGLTIADFERMCNLGLFNAELINDAIYKFKRYEDASLEYTGLLKNETQTIGGFDETISREVFYNKED